MKLTTIFLALILSINLTAQTGLIIKDADITFKALQKDGPPTSEEEFLNGMFYTNATVNLSGDIFYLGRVTNPVDKTTKPVIKKITNGKLVNVPIDFDGYQVFDGQSFRDACSIDSQTILVAADKALFKFKKKEGGFILDKVMKYEEDNAVVFTKIVDLENGKCAAIAYTSLNNEFKDVHVLEYKDNNSMQYQIWKYDQKNNGNTDVSYNDYFREIKNKPFSTNGYLVIWDYNNNEANGHLMNNDVCDETIIKKNQDGDLLVSLATKTRVADHLTGMNRQSLNNFLYLIDVSETIKQNEIVSLWNIRPYVGTEYSTEYGFVVTDLIEEPNGDIVFVGIQKNMDQHYHNHYNLNIYTTALCIGRVTKLGEFEILNSSTSMNLNSWGGSDKGALESKLMPGMIYFGNVGKPKLMHAPNSDGYIIVHRGAFDQITYPAGYRSSEHTVAADAPLFIYMNKKSLTIESFDIMNTSMYSKKDGTSSYKLDNGYKRQFNAPHFGPSTELVEYDKTTKEFKVYETDFSIVSESFIWTCKPTFTKGWISGDAAVVTASKSNALADELAKEQAKLREWMDAHDSDNSTAANNYSNGGGSNNSNSYSENSSSDTNESEVKLVQVYVDPKGKTVKIYWEQGGSSKRFTLTGSRRAIGDIPEGTKLSYSTGPDHVKKIYFYTVPIGKSSVSVEL